MENRTFYASKCGAVLDSDVYCGGGTDDTAALQAVLDKAPVLGRLHLVLDGAALISKSLKIHSNTTIECPDKSCGVFLSSGSDCCTVQNASLDFKTIRDRNITLLGGVYNNNSPGQIHHSGDHPEVDFETTWIFGIRFYGVENLILRDVTIANQRTFALAAANWKNVYMENIHVDRRERPDSENQDGLHFWGPGRFLTLRNIRGNSGDDFIALAPDEHDKVSSIEDVLIDGVHLEEADQGIRLLVRGEGKLDRVIIRNVTGTYRSFGFFINPWFEGKGGTYGNIVFDTVDLRPLKPNYGYHSPFLFKLGGNIESLVMKNIFHHTPAHNHQLFIVGGNYVTDSPEDANNPSRIRRLVVDGLYIDERCPEAVPESYFRVKSAVDFLSVRNVILHRDKVLGKAGSFIKVEDGLIKELELHSISAPSLHTLLDAPAGRVEHSKADNIS
jgi:polygalacturonase